MKALEIDDLLEVHRRLLSTHDAALRRDRRTDACSASRAVSRLSPDA